MLTANQFHKQSGIQVEFQDFLQKMKISFGDNFMEKVNEGKVKLQEVQQALGLRITKEEKNTLKTKNITSKTKNIASDRKNVRVRKITPQTKSASGLKCASCESNKNASGKKKNTSVRNIALALGIVAVLVWAVKNRK